MTKISEIHAKLHAIVARHYAIMMEHAHPDEAHRQEQREVSEMAHAMLDAILGMPAGASFDPKAWVAQSKWPALREQLSRVLPIMVSTLKVLKMQYSHPTVGLIEPRKAHYLFCVAPQPTETPIDLSELDSFFTVNAVG